MEPDRVGQSSAVVLLEPWLVVVERRGLPEPRRLELDEVEPSPLVDGAAVAPDEADSDDEDDELAAVVRVVVGGRFTVVRVAGAGVVPTTGSVSPSGASTVPDSTSGGAVAASVTSLVSAAAEVAVVSGVVVAVVAAVVATVVGPVELG